MTQMRSVCRSGYTLYRYRDHINILLRQGRGILLPSKAKGWWPAEEVSHDQQIQPGTPGNARARRRWLQRQRCHAHAVPAHCHAHFDHHALPTDANAHSNGHAQPKCNSDRPAADSHTGAAHAHAHTPGNRNSHAYGQGHGYAGKQSCWADA